jgi:hypothetical protein
VPCRVWIIGLMRRARYSANLRAAEEMGLDASMLVDVRELLAGSPAVLLVIWSVGHLVIWSLLYLTVSQGMTGIVESADTCQRVTLYDGPRPEKGCSPRPNVVELFINN